jgi:hypothetical protein
MNVFLELWNNDKSMVIVSLLILGIVSMALMGASAATIVASIVSGVCGIAVGKTPSPPAAPDKTE